jgi:fatty-acyl-CoA synthase
VTDDGASSLTVSSIRAHLKISADAGSIPKFAIPDQILFVDALPKTSVGKFDKKALKEQYNTTSVQTNSLRA